VDPSDNMLAIVDLPSMLAFSYYNPLAQAPQLAIQSPPCSSAAASVGDALPLPACPGYLGEVSCPEEGLSRTSSSLSCSASCSDNEDGSLAEDGLSVTANLEQLKRLIAKLDSPSTLDWMPLREKYATCCTSGMRRTKFPHDATASARCQSSVP